MPKAVICNKGAAFKSQLMKMYFHALSIKPIYVSPSNHGSKSSQRYIRTVNDIIIKNLEGTADDWPILNKQVSLFHHMKLYVSLCLRVQNAVPAQPCVGKLAISLVLLNFLHCNFRLWFKTP